MVVPVVTTAGKVPRAPHAPTLALDPDRLAQAEREIDSWLSRPDWREPEPEPDTDMPPDWIKRAEPDKPASVPWGAVRDPATGYLCRESWTMYCREKYPPVPMPDYDHLDDEPEENSARPAAPKRKPKPKRRTYRRLDEAAVLRSMG